MPPEPPESEAGIPSDWMRHAKSDLVLARGRISPEVLLDTLCFHAQQAAEKSIKAVLVWYEVPFPKTHHLKTLLELLPATCRVPEEVSLAASLSDYAVASRYPGAHEEVTEAEHEEAVHLAEAVVAWAEQIVAQDRQWRQTP